MQIDLPPSDEVRLAQHAAAAGYADVALWATDFLVAQAQMPIPAELSVLSDDELQASIELCERRVAEQKAGNSRDFREAMLDLGRKRGYSLPE